MIYGRLRLILFDLLAHIETKNTKQGGELTADLDSIK
jgi:hypothetical protein